MTKNKNKSFYGIVRSTGLLGGSQVVTILVNIVRNKVIAILLGSVGLGLISIYQSIIDLIKSVSTIGIETAGIKDIASTQNEEELIETVSVMKQGIFFLSCIGSILCIAFCYPISIWAFDSDKYYLQIALLSVCVFFNILNAGEMLILQGLQKVSYIVKSTIIWNILSLVISIPLFFLFNINAIVLVFIVISIITYITNRFFREKIELKFVILPKSTIFTRGKKILKTGIFILLTTIQTQFTLFLLKSLIIDKLGLVSLGLVQASWTITNVYITLILSAMGSDFYPKLSAIINKNTRVRRLINEQVYFILLVSVPVVIFLLICSKLVLNILYSSDFELANTLLHWILVGSFVKALSWVFGFVLISKEKGFLFLFTDILFSLIYLVISFYLLPSLGIDAIGIGYLIGYLIYLGVVYLVSRRICSFRWNSNNLKTAVISSILLISTFCFIHYEIKYGSYLSILLFIVSVTYSIYQFNQILSLTSFYKKLKNK